VTPALMKHSMVATRLYKDTGSTWVRGERTRDEMLKEVGFKREGGIEGKRRERIR